MADRIETPPQASETDGRSVGTAPAGARVRSRLARMGSRGGTGNPVLEPLLNVYRSTHPKGDVEVIQKAYEIAERMRASGQPVRVGHRDIGR